MNAPHGLENELMSFVVKVRTAQMFRNDIERTGVDEDGRKNFPFSLR